ncbi:Uncharacterised protein [Bordetella pertussis]|nr:Uncharacterised protein [Bordetella pertussis]CPJ72413.1 Uncharacterised protein [Bordetella pertussis]
MRRQQQDAVAQHQRFFDRMGNEQQRERCVLPQAQQLFLHAPARQGVERGEWLVHQQNARLHRQGPRDRHPLLHAARQGMRIGIGERAQADLLQIVRGALQRLRTRQAARRHQAERHVFPHRLPGRQLVELLEHHHPVRSRRVYRPSVEQELSLAWRQKTGRGLEQGGFSAARRPQQDEAIGRQHVEADAMRGAHAAPWRLVLQRHAVGAQQRFGRGIETMRAHLSFPARWPRRRRSNRASFAACS